MSTQEILNKYFKILTSGSIEGMEAIVAETVSFSGPFFQATNQDEFLHGLQQWVRLPKTYHMQKQFIEGNSTCSIYTVVITSPSGETVHVDMADWIEVSEGKIASERVYFDPTTLARALGRTL